MKPEVWNDCPICGQQLQQVSLAIECSNDFFHYEVAFVGLYFIDYEKISIENFRIFKSERGLVIYEGYRQILKLDSHISVDRINSVDKIKKLLSIS